MLMAPSKKNPMSVPSLRVTIVALLPGGAPSIRRAAMAENVSVRTLQRRLAEPGYTYSQLVDAVRCDMACHLVADPKTRLCDISTTLGFSFPSCFTRAFRRWTEMEPRAYRHRALREFT
jgi:AraC-like DNA-binding protein